MVYTEFNNRWDHLKLKRLKMTLPKHKEDRVTKFILHHPKFKMACKINSCQVITEVGEINCALNKTELQRRKSLARFTTHLLLPNYRF